MKDQEIKEILYTDESGEISILFDVQLMEDIPRDRIPKLIKLLASKDRYISYQAMLLLIAWGIEEGFNQLDFFIEEELDKSYEYEPHRIWGSDNVYDHIAESLEISTYNSISLESISPYLLQLLNLYGEKFFDSKLKTVLFKIGTKLSVESKNEFTIAILNAIEACIDKEKYFQGSQLLPILVSYDQNEKSKYISKFTPLLVYDDRIRLNLNELEDI